MSQLQSELDMLRNTIGEEQEPGKWFEITQGMVDKFAEVTGDHQWIHVDVHRASKGLFKAPIAHGHLTLSLIGRIDAAARKNGVVAQQSGNYTMTINYGFNRVRFPAPVTVGKRVRIRKNLKSAEIRSGMIETMTEVTVEIEGQDKPACVAESLTRLIL